MRYLPQPAASADNVNLCLNNSRYPAQPHPIIINYWVKKKILNTQQEPLISIGNEAIKKFGKRKILCVIIDDKLLWKDHINEISVKVSKGLGIMKIEGSKRL